MFNILRIHTNLLFTLVLLLIVLALTCALQALRDRNWHPWLRSGIAIAELLLITEALLGGMLWLQGARPAQALLHIIYSIVAVLAIPISMQASKERTTRQQQITVGLVCVFLIAIVLRALQTGRIS